MFSFNLDTLDNLQKCTVVWVKMAYICARPIQVDL